MRIGRKEKKVRKKVEIPKLDFLDRCLKEFRVHMRGKTKKVL
jgi:hypothetical protein